MTRACALGQGSKFLKNFYSVYAMRIIFIGSASAIKRYEEKFHKVVETFVVFEHTVDFFN